jgi:hypothetical protein
MRVTIEGIHHDEIKATLCKHLTGLTREETAVLCC